MIGWLLLAMIMSDAGMVMNQNSDRLPRGCDAVSKDLRFEIEAGTEFASAAPGTVFGMSRHELTVPPCSRITIRFTNRDAVRHQWMVHGLPRYLYPGGMFHIEANGGASLSGTFIVPPDDKTYLLHCDMAQHMEKGMKGQLVVGRGSGDLWGVQGVSGDFERDGYLSASWFGWIGLVAAAAVAGGCWLGLGGRKRH